MEKEVLLKQAIKNQKYYLHEKKELAWFRYLKKFTPYTETVLVTPEMAAELLQSVPNFNLRKPIPFKILKQLVELVKTEELIKGYITINLSGELIDGANLLQAIVAADKSIALFVVFNTYEKI